MDWVTPITDRTLADVEYADAHRGNLTENKGARSHWTLQRIADNMRHIVDLFGEVGVNPPELVSEPIWDMSKFPFRYELEKIKTDLENIGGVWFTLETTPTVPDLPWTHYQKLNDIEQILLNIHDAIIRMKSIYTRANSVFSHANSALYFVETTTLHTPTPPEIITESLPDGAVGDGYSFQLESTSTSLAQHLWYITGGKLPLGLTMTIHGLISGKPKRKEVEDVTLTVENAGGSATRQYEINVMAHDTAMRAGSIFNHSGSTIYIRQGELQ